MKNTFPWEALSLQPYIDVKKNLYVGSQFLSLLNAAIKETQPIDQTSSFQLMDKEISKVSEQDHATSFHTILTENMLRHFFKRMGFGKHTIIQDKPQSRRRLVVSPWLLQC